MFREFKDEVLDPSLQPDVNPRYTIKDNNGKVINDDVQIEMKTPVVQNSTPLNRANISNIQGDLYTQDRYNKVQFDGDIMTLDLPLTSYEAGKIVNIECDSKLDETTKTQIIPSSGWNTVVKDMAINENGMRIEANKKSSSFGLQLICDGDVSTYWRPDDGTTSLDIKYILPHKVKATKMWLKLEGFGLTINVTIKGIDSNSNEHILFHSTKEYYNMETATLTGDIDYYSEYVLNVTGTGDDADIPYIYVWNISEIQGTLYENFENPYLNINKLGNKKINGIVKHKEKTSLVYNGESWDIINGVVTGRYASPYNDATTVKIELGFKPKYVILFSNYNMSDSIGVSTVGTVYPSYIPRIISEISNSDTLNDDGFTVNLSGTGNSNVYHSFCYIAIR